MKEQQTDSTSLYYMHNKFKYQNPNIFLMLPQTYSLRKKNYIGMQTSNIQYFIWWGPGGVRWASGEHWQATGSPEP